MEKPAKKAPARQTARSPKSVDHHQPAAEATQ